MRIISRWAAWVAVLGMPAVAWALTRSAWALWDARGEAAQVEDLMAVGAACGGAAVAGYLATTAWAMLLSALIRGGRTVPRSVTALAPVSWQRVTATALGITMSAGVATPALASQPSDPHVGWGDPVAAQTVSPAHVPAVGSPGGWPDPGAVTAPPVDGGAMAVGFVPAPSHPTPSPPTPLTRPLQVPHPTAPSTAQDTLDEGTSEPTPTDSSTYTVRRGDSLWRITATLLGPGASDVSINRYWPQLYAANANAIGADPALIHPGLVLTVPTGIQS
ncbi:MAG: hypothetical protein CVT68_00555 [Actinobacteria bacterium HGW-Actinobacteria-8]|nr:MAG: hypothetical protein CVT68_00555 [Actinobacteria bacterium HGW-Actinobacteria-8]